MQKDSPHQQPIDLEEVKGIGPQRKLLLNKLGVFSVEDLLFFPPRRYDDRRSVKKIADLTEGEVVTVYGEVTGASVQRGRRMRIFRLRVKDETGRLSCVWFNQPYLKNQFEKKDKVIVTGKVKVYRETELQLVAPEFEVLKEEEQESSESIHMGRIVPIYPLTEGISQKVLRSLVFNALESHLKSFSEIFPLEWVAKSGWMPRGEALQKLHFPDGELESGKARERLAYEEFFIMQLGILMRAEQEISQDLGFAHQNKTNLQEKLLKAIPFTLTVAQRRVIEEIARDMRSSKPMNRLLQGDVGSGKTVVAMWAMANALSSGSQCALMAPTEILAEQHFWNFRKWFQPLGIDVGLLRSDMSAAEKSRVLRDIASGHLKCVIGTHALIQQKVTFADLSLVVIDEQHKFGVMQRAKLRQKGGRPDLLVMTATPIPRTLALTVYGDLEVSLLNELPPGRSPITTKWITQSKLKLAYDWIKGEVKKGRQVYLLYPLVEESEKVDLKSAVTMFEAFNKKIFKEERVGLIHGQLPYHEKEQAMADFKKQKLDILVSTTVIEVGIDVPNATIMLIDNAERYGLAQLHQLRGRVGRGSLKSYCILVGKPKTEEGKIRLKTMVETQDGFKIAEEDLRLRGPGEFLGTRQHGIPALRVGNLVSDFQLLELARSHVCELIQTAAIETFAWKPVIHQVQSRFAQKIELVHA